MNGGDNGRKWWRSRPMSASGIVRVRTGFLPRLDRTPRPKLPRPSLAACAALFGLAAVLAGGAVLHRRFLDERLVPLLTESEAAPFEIRRIRQDLTEQELDQKSLEAELKTRLDYARSQKSREFYVVLDTGRRRFAFKFGDKVLRDAPLDIGAPRVVHVKSGKSWTFVPVTGAFSVQEKLENAEWNIPGWRRTSSGGASRTAASGSRTPTSSGSSTWRRSATRSSFTEARYPTRSVLL
jgi:hypothetical protein